MRVKFPRLSLRFLRVPPFLRFRCEGEREGYPRDRGAFMSGILTSFAGMPVAELARRHGTPFFAYDQAVLEKRVSELKAFDAIRYAQKASSNLALLTLMRRLG